MGKALVKTDYNHLSGSIDQWNLTQGYSSFTPLSNHNSSETAIHSANKIYNINWHIKETPKGLNVVMTIKPHLWWFITLLTTMCISLALSLVPLDNVLEDFNFSNFFSFALLALIIFILINWESKYLPLRIMALENTFWSQVRNEYDCEILRRATGSPYSKYSKITIQLLFFAYLFGIGYLFFGITGGVFFLLSTSPVMVMILAETFRNDDIHWHWKLWVVNNMGKMTFFMMPIFGIIVVLLALEYCHDPMLNSTTKENLSIRESLDSIHLRNLSEINIQDLEADTYNRIKTISLSIMDQPADTSDYELVMYIYCIPFYIIILICIYFCTLRPTIKLLKDFKPWHYDLSEKKNSDINTPYLSNSWLWDSPKVLRALIVFHWLFGGVINILAAVFILDGILYAVFTHNCIYDGFTVIWSFVFVINKILLGQSAGQIIAIVMVTIIAIPLILFVISTMRRLFSTFILVFKLLTNINLNQVISELQPELDNLCRDNDITRPRYIVINSQQSFLQVYHLLFLLPVIEISEGALKLLTKEELKAAIAHEVGHIKQGLLIIDALKLLSTLALFPNYYLTLCIDWPKKEIEADRFAVLATNDPTSLQGALIKLTTYPVTISSNKGIFLSGFAGKLKSYFQNVITSVRFYYGDSLYGYNHPYITERITEINMLSEKING